MDITSFILGRKNGRDSVKTQEKTVTPGEEEIVVTPDTGFDALSKVIVEAVTTGGGSGDGAGVQFFRGSVSPPSGSDKGYRVSVNFGFQPDIIFMAYTGQTARQTKKGRVYIGYSAAAAAFCGLTNQYNYCLYDGTNDWMYDSNSQPIEATNTYTPIYNADPTGFNLGYAPLTGKSYTIHAWKLPL